MVLLFNFVDIVRHVLDKIQCREVVIVKDPTIHPLQYSSKLTPKMLHGYFKPENCVIF